MGAGRVCTYEITRGIEVQILSNRESFRANQENSIFRLEETVAMSGT
jgi:hypothetical protein